MVQNKKFKNKLTHIKLIKFDNEAQAVQWKENSILSK